MSQLKLKLNMTFAFHKFPIYNPGWNLMRHSLMLWSMTDPAASIVLGWDFAIDMS